ncbi:amidohydrolase family protein [Cohnella sp. CFH 77786]|uniref:amidohydrolase family protein n=1 Tax=Cohnella sp. CFH 77786 TaxID=2662265 RepID=UPI001C60F68A|nr:amidohydrolase family protein [Cohnella sp. CFH 77786]MBW5447915.1 amidohydrolase family protein [Cohnella sp. CFH 77786]
MAELFDLIIRNARFANAGTSADIAVDGGIVAATGDLADVRAATEIDADGMLALPPFVEPHVHLDTVLTAGIPAWNESGTLAEGIALWSARKASLTKADVLSRAEEAIRLLVRHGVLHMRAMVDISDPKLTALEAVLELKERYRERLTVQVTAFPQDGIESGPGNEERMEEALRMGAEAVSAVPHLESTREDGVLSLRKVFALAERRHASVHVFCDETDDGESRFLEVCASLALSTGLESRAAAAHANAAAYYNEPYFQKVLGAVKRSGMSIVACPLINSVMQGRYDAYPKGRGVTRIREFHRAGVNVALAHDDIRTPFYPLGTGNPLDAAHMAAHLAHMTGQRDLRDLIGMVTTGGAKAMNLGTAYGYAGGFLAPGDPASLLLFEAGNEGELIRDRPAPRYVISRGKMLAETLPAPTWLGV